MLNGSYGLTPPDLDGLLEPDAGRLASPVPRGVRRRKAPDLPDIWIMREPTPSVHLELVARSTPTNAA